VLAVEPAAERTTEAEKARYSPAVERTVVEGQRGTVTLDRYETVLVIRAKGHAHTSQAEPFIRTAAIVFASAAKRPALFYDFGDLLTYDSEFRKKLTEHYAQHRDRAERPRLLTGSKLVAMGTAVANLALGGVIVTYTERTKFETELSRILRERGER
jgi:hypothetical protein